MAEDLHTGVLGKGISPRKTLRVRLWRVPVRVDDVGVDDPMARFNTKLSMSM